MISFQRTWCNECKDYTLHEQPEGAPGHFCMRHASQVLKSYNEDAMRRAILEARKSVTDFPAWQAVRSRN